MDIRIEIDEVAPNAWDDFVAAAPTGHLLQSSTWGRLKCAFGWESGVVTLRQRDEIVAGAQVLFRPLPIIGRFRKTIAYVPKGPVIDYADPTLLSHLLRGLDGLCKRHGAALLKFEPDEHKGTPLHHILTAAAFRPSSHAVQPLATMVIDLRQSPDVILAQMSSKTRYNIRLAERKGVRVRPGSEDDVARFHALSMTTGQRDGFDVHELDYYMHAFRLFREHDAVQLFLAEYEGELLAGLMVFAFGQKSWYLYGASSNAERQRMPNHLLQWTALNWARDKGCWSYDLWGIPREAPELEASGSVRVKDNIQNPPPGTLWGVYRFKRGFGGDNVRYIGAYDRVYSPALYWTYDRIVARRQGLSA